MKNAFIFFALIIILIFSYITQKSKVSLNPLTFEMETTTGKITLDELRKNHKIIILYFGFLSCPEACPTTLGTMANTINDLPKEKLDQVAFVFVDLDPERDQLADIKNYTEFFSKKIIPISIPLKDLEHFTKKFGIVFKKMKIESKLDYTIDHSTDVIVLGQDGKLLSHIEHGSPKVVYLDRINKILNNEGASL